MDNENAIEIRNMTKEFRTYRDKSRTLKEMLVRRNSGLFVHEVLKDISLDVKKGETVALIGTNGSGKSTLLKIMTRILYPNEGTVKTNGKVTSLLELGAGFHPDFTGRENIYFNAAIFGLSRKEIERRVDDIIEFSELGRFIDEPVRTYSSGMYMRLAFSVAINVDADILLIDEILGVGDQHFQNKCFEKLEELRDSDKTIVIVSHALDSVKTLCSRAVWIYKGELKLDGDPAYVISQYLKQSAIDNKEEIKKEKEEGTFTPKGHIFFDEPQGFDVISQSQPLTVRGWSVSNEPDTKLEILFDGFPVKDIRPVTREDVYEVYNESEDFADLLDVDKIGFECQIPPERLEGQVHKIEGILKFDGKAIDKKKLSIRTGSVQASGETA